MSPFLTFLKFWGIFRGERVVTSLKKIAKNHHRTSIHICSVKQILIRFGSYRDVKEQTVGPTNIFLFVQDIQMYILWAIQPKNVPVQTEILSKLYYL